MGRSSIQLRVLRQIVKEQLEAWDVMVGRPVLP
jgi:hypothetical protein